MTPATGAVSLAERMHIRSPGLVAVLYALADVSRGLADIHRQGRGFGPLSPEHVLLMPGPTGRDVATLPPVWWAWPHGFDAAAAAPWVAPGTSGHFSARDAWSVGAIAWHTLTGGPPGRADDSPKLRMAPPATTPPDLAALLDELLHEPLSAVPVDLASIAERLERAAHVLEGGQGPAIAPPMLLGTPLPVGGQLRPRGGPLVVPPPPPVLPDAATPARPIVGFGPEPTLAPPDDEEPLLPEEELLAAARASSRGGRGALDVQTLALGALAVVLLGVVVILALYVGDVLG